MSSVTVPSLPPFPSTHIQKLLSPFQHSQLANRISLSLLQTIALPPPKHDTPASRAFVSSYAKDTALQCLKALIWKPQQLTPDIDKTISKRVLLLATKLALSPPGFDTQTLLDLAIVYAPTYPSRTRDLFTSSLKSSPSLQSTFQARVVPSFTTLLSPAHSAGLYGLRKTSHCLCCLLHGSPPEIIRLFAHDKYFVLALARAYDEGLAAIAHSYGGIHVAEDREVDDWVTIWVETKVALIDTFHAILSTILQDITSASGLALARESENAFNIIFGLLDLPSHSNTATPTPFLNRSLLTDYQQTYSLSQTLVSALNHAAEKDARTDLLESILCSLSPTPSDSEANKDTGVLKFLLHSSGVAPGIDHRGHGTKNGKGKGKAPHAALPAQLSKTDIVSDSVPDLEGEINKVLDILPDHSRKYVRALLIHPAYFGSAESVVGALLEGTAPRPVDVEDVEPEENFHVGERKNVWDEDVMDLKNVRVGKKIQDETTVLKDRTFIEQMKADILRRAEEISSDDDEGGYDATETIPGGSAKGKQRSQARAFEDEQDDSDALGAVKVIGDGEGSSGSEVEENEEDKEDADLPQTPETVLELAYIRDPSLFDRDGATRRGKARAELRALTGWADEQIEGWRIMLERNPKKNIILQKHEFAGNRIITEQVTSTAHGPLRGGRGRGRGRGGGGRGEGAGEGSTRDRALKDKNKASRGNHNRKTGHDKKMARAGGPS